MADSLSQFTQKDQGKNPHYLRLNKQEHLNQINKIKNTLESDTIKNRKERAERYLDHIARLEYRLELHQKYLNLKFGDK